MSAVSESQRTWPVLQRQALSAARPMLSSAMHAIHAVSRADRRLEQQSSRVDVDAR
jgi:hypothetical protein